MKGGKGGDEDKSEKLERILKEIINKVAQVIIQSRIDLENKHLESQNHSKNPRSSTSDLSLLDGSSQRASFGTSGDSNTQKFNSNKRIQNKWFGLLLDDVEGVYESLSFWRRNPFHPFLLDIFLSHPESSSSTTSSSSSSSTSSSNSSCLLERWCLYHDSQSSTPTQETSNVYKRSIVLIRFLYTYVRLLPTYHKVVKICSSRQPITDYFLSYQIYSTSPPPLDSERTNFLEYRFTPVHTQSGSLCLSVQYRRDMNFQLVKPRSGIVVSRDVISEYTPSSFQTPSIPIGIRNCPSTSSPGSYLTSPPDSFINTTTSSFDTSPSHQSFYQHQGIPSNPSSYDPRLFQPSVTSPLSFPRDTSNRSSNTFAPGSAPTSGAPTLSSGKGYNYLSHSRPDHHHFHPPPSIPDFTSRSDDEPPIIHHPEPFFLEEDTSEEKELLLFLDLCKTQTNLDFSVPSEPQTLSDVLSSMSIFQQTFHDYRSGKPVV